MGSCPTPRIARATSTSLKPHDALTQPSPLPLSSFLWVRLLQTVVDRTFSSSAGDPAREKQHAMMRSRSSLPSLTGKIWFSPLPPGQMHEMDARLPVPALWNGYIRRLVSKARKTVDQLPDIKASRFNQSTASCHHNILQAISITHITASLKC